MQSVAIGEGRTVLFVSHNMTAVEALCSSAILMSSGRLLSEGETTKVVRQYLGGVNREAAQQLHDRPDRHGTGEVFFTSVSLADAIGQQVMSFQCGSPATLNLHFENRSGRELRNMRIAIGVDNEFGVRVLLLDSTLVKGDLARIEPDGGTVSFFMPRLALMPGRYQFTIFGTVNGEITDWIKNAGFFFVEGGNYFGTGQLPEHGQCVFAMDHAVSFVQKPEDAAKAMKFLGK